MEWIPWRRRMVPWMALAAFIGCTPAAGDEQQFVAWQAFNVKFHRSPARIYFLASTYVLNLTGEDFRDLTFEARAPESFAIELASPEIQKAMRRPQGFAEELDGTTYRMRLPFLGGGQGTTLFYQLLPTGRVENVTFPGLQIHYTAGGEVRTFQAMDEVHDLRKYGRYSGDLSDFIKRYAGFSIDLDGGPDPPDWSFSALDYRAFGTNANGIVEITGGPEASGHFRLQAGYPGDFREILVRWEPKERGRKDPVTPDLARTQLESMIRWVGDFSLDSESIKASKVTFARLPAVLVEGRWSDNKPVRLGSGRFRFYVFHDSRGGRDVFLYVGVQGRGIGPDAADTPAPEVEERLMQELIRYAETFRP